MPAARVPCRDYQWVLKMVPYFDAAQLIFHFPIQWVASINCTRFLHMISLHFNVIRKKIGKNCHSEQTTKGCNANRSMEEGLRDA